MGAGAAPPGADLGFELPAPPQVKKSRILLILGVLFACVAVAFVAGQVPREAAKARLQEHASPGASHQPLKVSVVAPKLLRSDVEITLPGSVEPLASTTIYPQAAGYIKRFLVDIGAHVKEGELLAEIETPALDQELDQARAALLQAEASLGQAQANRDYTNVSLQRYSVLKPSGVASQQELDQRSSEAKVAEANVAAAQAAVAVQRANIRRLTQLKDFARVTAPFAGIITTRSIERGSLVSVGNSTPLFRLVATDPVRVFVQVPQDVAPGVRVGAEASISLREYAGRTFTGIIAHTAGALDVTTRTLNTEVRVPNPDNELLTGMYSNVSLKLAVPHQVYELPGTALYNDAQGLRVAVVDDANRVRFVPVTIERDLGATLQIASGLTGQERVIRLVNASLTEGRQVQIESQAQEEAGK
jgi:RND family efflux transporter MFP subunit